MWFGVGTGASALQELPEAGQERCEMDMSKLWGYHSDDALFKGSPAPCTVDWWGVGQGFASTVRCRRHREGDCDASVSSGEIGEGTVIGVSYNQASGPPTINFFLDGVLVEGAEIDNIRGVALPTVGTAGATVLKCNFSHEFKCTPPGRYEKYDGIMLAGSMI
jgi:hypothetical protein